MRNRSDPRADRPASRSPRPLTDADYLPQILQAYREGDYAEADILRSKLTAACRPWPLPSGSRSAAACPIGFERIVAFQRDYPDWPVTSPAPPPGRGGPPPGRRRRPRVRAYFAEPAADERRRQASPWRSPSRRTASTSEAKRPDPARLARGHLRPGPREPDPRRVPGRPHPGRPSLPHGAAALQGELGRRHAGGRVCRQGLRDARQGADGRLPRRARRPRRPSAPCRRTCARTPSYIFSRALYLRRKEQARRGRRSVMAKAPRDPDAPGRRRRVVDGAPADRPRAPRQGRRQGRLRGREPPRRGNARPAHRGRVPRRLDRPALPRRSATRRRSTSPRRRRIADDADLRRARRLLAGPRRRGGGRRGRRAALLSSAPPTSRSPITASSRARSSDLPIALRAPEPLDDEAAQDLRGRAAGAGPAPPAADRRDGARDQLSIPTSRRP